ncbi:MAG: hypothetical protein A4E31_00071 [Methanomassiliicoccales archaeon PtaU1.Bin030]|nr:MAG: hypothetical protein A4E31_00071 [Methanomassiliicoccales archaeon PtaU1.Bin030]
MRTKTLLFLAVSERSPQSMCDGTDAMEVAALMRPTCATEPASASVTNSGMSVLVPPLAML